jgi:hypothetical protein
MGALQNTGFILMDLASVSAVEKMEGSDCFGYSYKAKLCRFG